MADKTTGTLETTGNLLFYKNPEPLNSEAHSHLGITADSKNPYGFARDTQLVPITVSEFAAAALSYPIIFAGTEHSPAAVMGLQKDHNAYVGDDGLMPDGAYVPGFMRRYPFVPATNNGDTTNMTVCIDRDANVVTENPEQPFFVDGKPSEFTKRAIEFIQTYENESHGTLNFVKVMEELELFETQDVTIPQNSEDRKSIVQQKIGEFVGLSHKKLNALSSKKIMELRDNGGLMAIYSQMLSQSNWQRLVAQEMKNPAKGDGIGTPAGKA
ncbi:MAG: peptidase [Robiginitomaculum sp.]|nr:MAG: peptidase [Robiginitomaculum sp.]